MRLGDQRNKLFIDIFCLGVGQLIQLEIALSESFGM